MPVHFENSHGRAPPCLCRFGSTRVQRVRGGIQRREPVHIVSPCFIRIVRYIPKEFVLCEEIADTVEDGPVLVDFDPKGPVPSMPYVNIRPRIDECSGSHPHEPGWIIPPGT